MNGIPDYIGDPKLYVVRFIDGLPEVLEQAATWIRKETSLNVGPPDVSHMTLNENEDGDWILELYIRD